MFIRMTLPKTTTLSSKGDCFSSGDVDVPFSVQSISKVFSLTMALGTLGDTLWTGVGREPSGSAFNSIVQLETESGIPRNPFINSGAIVIADILLASYRSKEVLGEFLRFMRMVSDDDTITIDDISLGSPPRRPKTLWALARSGAPNAKEVSLDGDLTKISSVLDRAASL